MRRAFLIATSLVCVVAACSGSSADQIPAQSSSGGTATGTENGDGGGGTSSSSGSSGETCPPCEPPPDPSCKGTGPCGCGPYRCADGGADSGAEGDCTWGIPDPCGPGKYCQANNCGKGTCVPLGTLEAFAKNAVCGCDGVTYWNESVAAKHGMSVRRTGACAGNDTATCGGFMGKACPHGASCNLQRRNATDCGVADTAGTCWQLPTACPPIVVGARTRSCESKKCIDECNLIKSSAAYYEDMTCPQ